MIVRMVKWMILLGVLALTACKAAAVTTPEPTLAPVPTSAMVVPVATATAPITPTSSAPTSVVVVRQEASPMAIVNLQKLQPGRKYRLAITSSAGAVAFSGTWSESAVGADGLPGVKTGLLEGTTPANLDILPPMASVAKDWVYSAQVSNKAGGSITLTIFDVTP
jgi:hypothetical protein